jgi:NAD dependent epimerase/dehydratase family enzyme
VIDDSEVVINLDGRSVSCRYTKTNLTEMMRSRVRSARVVGEAIAAARRPPRIWLQVNTATIYAHRFDAPSDDEATDVVGGRETGVLGYWATGLAALTSLRRGSAN